MVGREGDGEGGLGTWTGWQLLCLQVLFASKPENFLLRAEREIGQLSQQDKHKVNTNSSSNNNDNNVTQIVENATHTRRQAEGEGSKGAQCVVFLINCQKAKLAKKGTQAEHLWPAEGGKRGKGKEAGRKRK